jgi:hypothetical protein
MYPLGKGSEWGDNELRYSLRSFVQNFPDLGPVIIVGERPAWLSDEAVHIPCRDDHKRNKDANLIRKAMKACRHEAMTEWFIRPGDDHCLLRPLRFSQWKARYAFDLAGCPPDFWTNDTTHEKYYRRLRRTYGLLLHEGRTTFHYDTHTPQPYQAERFYGTMRRWNFTQGLGYCLNTLYFNMIHQERRYALGINRKVDITRPMTADEIRRALEGRTFLNHNAAGLNDGLKEVLGELFPEPSKFENDGGEGVFADEAGGCVANV